MIFQNIFFDIDADSAYLERCILSCLGLKWAQNLQDFEIPLDTETNGTTHVLVRGLGNHFLDMTWETSHWFNPPKHPNTGDSR